MDLMPPFLWLAFVLPNGTIQDAEGERASMVLPSCELQYKPATCNVLVGSQTAVNMGIVLRNMKETSRGDWTHVT